jgi:small subunit ribosomal protein S6
MRDYELVLVVSPVLSSEKQKDQLEKIKKTIAGLKGEVKKTEEWGKKQLAYPIRKNEMGYYFLWEIQLPEKSLEELNQKLRIEESLLRYLIVKIEKRQKDKKAKGKGGKKHGSTLA